jgi:hypothetical protein
MKTVVSIIVALQGAFFAFCLFLAVKHNRRNAR